MISKSMHFGRMLPGRGLFSAFGEKGMHAVRFLPARALGPPQREERDGGGDADVGARWARCGRRSATRVRRRRRTMVVMGGAMSAGSARWRHRGMRMAARGGRDAGEAVQAAAGRYSGDGARWERAAARGRDGGAAWRAPWERVTVGQGPVSAGPGSGRAAESKTGERRWRRMGAGCGRWLISGAVGRLL